MKSIKVPDELHQKLKKLMAIKCENQYMYEELDTLISRELELYTTFVINPEDDALF